MMIKLMLRNLALALLASRTVVVAFQMPGGFYQINSATTITSNPSSLFMSSTKKRRTKKKGYEPKWKKKQTLADQQGKPTDLAQIGLKGDIPIIFRQGNETKTTMAYVGQPLRDAASQAGQFIKYGCGKGECGTCEALVNGQWIRPCSATVPPLPKGEEYVIQVKQVQKKVVSSGKFFSVRSFIMGFWNNFLGIVGFVKSRRAARSNWEERQDYEDLIRQKTMEKKQKRIKGSGAGKVSSQ